MSPHVESSPVLLVVLKTLTLILGGLITYYAYQAWKRTGSTALRALGVGFGLVTLGALVAGVTDLVFDYGLYFNSVVESTMTVLGFGVIVYSLYARE
jgi:hypothetical protein